MSESNLYHSSEARALGDAMELEDCPICTVTLTLMDTWQYKGFTGKEHRARHHRHTRGRTCESLDVCASNEG